MKKPLIFLLLTLFLLSGCTPAPHVGVDSSGLKPFVIGGIAPLTEESAALGLSMRNGAQLAVDEINATGGVNGFRLVLNFQDSKATPEIALTVYEKLKNNDMNALLGGILPEETAALAAACEKDGLLAITPSAGEKSALGQNQAMFRVCAEDSRLGITAANFSADKKLGMSAAVVYRDDRLGGKRIADSFITACTARDIFAFSVPMPDGLTVPAEEGGAILPEDLQCDILFLALSPEDTAAFLRQYPDRTEFLLACNPPADAEIPEGFAVLSSYFPDDPTPLAQNFRTSYTETFSAQPDRYAAEAYDGVYALAEAIKRAGVTPNNVEENDTNTKLKEAMTKIEADGVTGTLSWTPDGETTRPATVRIFRTDAFVPFENGEIGKNP